MDAAGNDAGPFSYSWSGVSGNGVEVTGNFTKKGYFTASVIVANSDGMTQEVSCPTAKVVDANNPNVVISNWEFSNNNPKEYTKSNVYEIAQCRGKTGEHKIQFEIKGGDRTVAMAMFDTFVSQGAEWNNQDDHFSGEAVVKFPLVMTIPENVTYFKVWEGCW